MKEIITVVTFFYPSSLQPTSCPFIQSLVNKWREKGYQVKVINPISKRRRKGSIVEGFHSDDSFPAFQDYVWVRKLFGLKRLQMHLMYKSAFRSIKRLFNSKTSVIYSHFLDSGFMASRLAKKYGKPAFCSFGESHLWSIRDRKMETVKNDLKHINGYISVSKRNTRLLIESGIANEDRIITVPNAVDLSLFHKIDKQIAKKELGLDSAYCYGIFVGSFIERKGPLRVAEATKTIPNLKMMYVGTGEQKPFGDNIAFEGTVSHESLYIYLSAADFFILPTLQEGCCNSIIEAMACGLPIISSKLSFNNEILSNDYSIMVDPTNIDELSSSVKNIVDDKVLREKMSKNALVKSKEFDLNLRADSILAYILNKG